MLTVFSRLKMCKSTQWRQLRSLWSPDVQQAVRAYEHGMHLIQYFNQPMLKEELRQPGNQDSCAT